MIIADAATAHATTFRFGNSCTIKPNLLIKIENVRSVKASVIPGASWRCAR